jgi:hypothetical protein
MAELDSGAGMSKTKNERLVFPVFDVPPAPRMTPKEFDRFLKETISLGKAAAPFRYDPVPAVFALVKEDVPSKDKR